MYLVILSQSGTVENHVIFVVASSHEDANKQARKLCAETCEVPANQFIISDTRYLVGESSYVVSF